MQGSRAVCTRRGSSKENISHFCEKCQMLFAKNAICNRIVTFCVPAVKTGKYCYIFSRFSSGADKKTARKPGRLGYSSFTETLRVFANFRQYRRCVETGSSFCGAYAVPLEAGRLWCGEPRQGQTYIVNGRWVTARKASRRKKKKPSPVGVAPKSILISFQRSLQAQSSSRKIKSSTSSDINGKNFLIIVFLLSSSSLCIITQLLGISKRIFSVFLRIPCQFFPAVFVTFDVMTGNFFQSFPRVFHTVFPNSHRPPCAAS